LWALAKRFGINQLGDQSKDRPPGERVGLQSPICRLGRGSPIHRSCPGRKRPWGSPSEGIPCRRSTIASTSLQPTIPHLTRSSLHRCLQRHGISRAPQVEGEASPKRKFKAHPIGYFHTDIAEVRTVEGKLHLLVAIDRTSKFAFIELHEKVTRRAAADFLRRLIEAVPCRVHTVLTDNGTHFTDPTGDAWSPAEIREMIANPRAFPRPGFRIRLRPQ
jgi:Integrase core domain